MDALSGKEFVRMLRLTKSVKEQGQVMVVIQLLNLNLPCDLVSFCVVLQCNWEVTAFVEFSEGCGPSFSWYCSACCWGANHLKKSMNEIIFVTPPKYFVSRIIWIRERSLFTATRGVVEFSNFRALKSCPPPESQHTKNLPPLKVCTLKFCPPPPSP